jgi:DNA-binding Lrp family transcriptional regulator
MTKLKTQLLEILNKDCRTPIDRMAVMTGVSTEEVSDAIREMEQEHVILHYAPIINWENTDKSHVEAMIEVRVTPQRDQGFDAVARRIYGFDEVVSVYLMSGGYDLLVLVKAPTLKELAYFVSEKLSVIDTVTGTSTSFVLKRYKQDGIIFDEEASDRRLVISP